MNGNDYIKALSENICNLRRKSELTQDTLAEKLDVTFQAVSKWENGLSSPDMMLLPQLADIFNVTIDELFNRQNPKSQQATDIVGLPWKNDNTIRGVVYKGHELLEKYEDISDFTFNYIGEVRNVSASCNISCGEIKGTVNAGGDINCENIAASVNNGRNVNCEVIGGNASAGGDINCETIKGNANANFSINCNHIEGNANCNDDLS